MDGQLSGLMISKVSSRIYDGFQVLYLGLSPVGSEVPISLWHVPKQKALASSRRILWSIYGWHPVNSNAIIRMILIPSYAGSQTVCKSSGVEYVKTPSSWRQACTDLLNPYKFSRLSEDANSVIIMDYHILADRVSKCGFNHNSWPPNRSENGTAAPLFSIWQHCLFKLATLRLQNRNT